MTTYSKRRGRRSLAAIAAAMLMASMLAVVAGAPAQAANTASEALDVKDNDGDGAKDDREFGGRDRYDTANRLAENFAGGESVPVAFVASGYKLVDAISVAGLAGHYDAPVLLTPSDSLDQRVADFIENYSVQKVHVLGGPGAVADSVVDAIEALVNEPTVTRDLAGANRYATAAAIASKLGGAAAWCGGTYAAAFLANGGDVSLAYAMAASPVANRLKMPLLLTAADELHADTEDFITDQGIDHVVIVGGESSVSDDVKAAVEAAGVKIVERIPGDTPADVSAALADKATNGCKTDLEPVSNDTVALVAESGLPDGVAASPVLTSSYRDGDLVPMLVVTDELPASVRDYLADTPESDGTNKLHLGIVAIGGTAAVSDEVMTAAALAASSAKPLTVQIGNATDNTPNDTNDADFGKDINGDGKVDGNDVPRAGDTHVTLYFSDNVRTATDTPTLLNMVRDTLMINDAPARLAETEQISQNLGANEGCDPDTVRVQLAAALAAGDVVSVAGGAKFGANMDQRTVAEASVTVPKPAADTTAPSVSVVAIAGTGDHASDVAKVRFTNIATPSDLATTDGKNQVNTGQDGTDDDEIKIVAADGSTKLPSDGLTLDNDGDITLKTGTLAAGDRITITSGALIDKAGNKSRARTFTVMAAPKSPRITSVTMSNLNYTAQAKIAVPSSLAAQVNSQSIEIIAKKGGAADGAAGNGWNIVFDVPSSWKDDPKAAVNIGVTVSSKSKLVSVRFNSGKAKFSDLKNHLEANSAFDSLFEVKLPAAAGACGASGKQPLVLANTVRQLNAGPTAGGVTKFAIEVRFSDYVSAIVDDNLLDDVLAGAAGRQNETTDGAVRTALGLESPTPASGFPIMMRRFEATTSDAAEMPMARDLVITARGTADGDQVARGYAGDDATTTTADESRNAKSRVFIDQSSSVKAPS